MLIATLIIILSLFKRTMSAKASFGAGCFWGTEKMFKKEFPKLKTVFVGYQGGHTDSVTYKEVCTGTTGHAEVLQVTYEPEEVSFRDLVTFFYKMHDPTTLNQQGNDRGTQYRSAIFFEDDEQKKIAEQVTKEVAENPSFKAAYGGRAITTEISKAGTFHIAEDHHQGYLDANPGGYCNHRKRWD